MTASSGQTGLCDRYDHEICEDSNGRLVSVHLQHGKQVALCMARVVESRTERGAHEGRMAPGVKAALRSKWFGRKKRQGHSGKDECACAVCHTSRQNRKAWAQSIETEGVAVEDSGCSEVDVRENTGVDE